MARQRKKTSYERSQRGRSNVKWDRRYEAQEPGRRMGPSGVYYEYRKNRSDLYRSLRV